MSKLHRIEIDAYTARVLQAEHVGAVVCHDHEDGRYTFTADETPEVLAVIYEVRT
jgi:hypothetical protein